MAETKLDEGPMTDDQLLREHQQSWNGFCKLLLYSTIAIVITLALMGIFLVD